MTQQRYPLNYDTGSAQEDAGRAEGIVETATEKLKDVGANAQELAENITEQARQYGEKAQDVAREVKPFVEKSLKDQPMTTLASAAVIGFVLGALWKK
jgi:ElaB/YqjD/DUF883 family membrane-anchored ribosome-binding protein